MSIIRKEWDKKYNASQKGKDAAKRYYYSERGQAIKKAYRRRYQMTQEQRERYRQAARIHEKEQKYKDRRRRYDMSAKGKAMKASKDKRYAQTESGKFSKHKTEIKRKRQLTASDCTLTRAQWIEIKEKYNHKCAYCHRQMTRLEMDHVIPLSLGGMHTAENVVPACRTCNASKGNRLLQPGEVSG